MLRRLPAAIALLIVAALAQAQPALRKQGTATQLIVDGSPFLILGGELGNSTASSVAGMRAMWPKLRAMHLNTVLAPVYWELIEPEEGRYEFASVDSLISDARANGMRLVLLWFGSWKNSMSSYVPAYVKTNQRRFPRTESTKGVGQEILSPFVAANWEADARVFRALMRHLRTIDGTRHTVLMVQVENEIGMIPTARDHSALADSLYALFEKPEDTPQTEELFMAAYFARYTQQVIAAGKKEYPLPMFANAALIRPGYQPGRYVSAGPLPHLIDVWRANAPSLDFIAPDIYFPNFTEWSDRYVTKGNPLFVPETILNPQTPVNAFYAFGARDAIGFSPFSIENADTANVALARSYALLAQLAPVILANQGSGTMTAVMPPVAFDGTVNDAPQTVKLGDYALTVSFERQAQHSGGGLIVALGRDEYLVAGTGLTITFAPSTPGDPITGILSAQEGHYEGGRWIADRRLNGDQTHQGRHIRLEPQHFSMQRVRLYLYR